MTWMIAIVVLLSCLCDAGVSGQVSSLNAERVCTGTDQGLALPYSYNKESKRLYYEGLKLQYTNCTYVDGNLEITFLNENEYDLSFLSSIREVTGYVLIVLTNSRVIPLTSLRVIRGTPLYENKYAIYMALTFHTQDPSIATEEIWLTSLHEILNGEVYFRHNNQLCYVETILWDDIRPGLVADITMWDEYPKRNCSEYTCHKSCDGHCWGPGQDLCQELTLTICSSTCDYRCRGPTQADCCHKSCAAGCTNSSNDGCLMCLHFSLDNTCVERCPPRYEYDRNTFTNVLNPNFRYSYESQCLQNCPDNVLVDGGNCVNVCGLGKTEEDNLCVLCDGVCPETCDGLQRREVLNGNHIAEKRFSNCTKINGNIIITSYSFSGDPFSSTPSFHPRELEVFSTVKQITGFLSIQASHPEFTNLSIFRNLERIDGRQLYGSHSSLSVLDSTFLQSVNLVSLKEITRGSVHMQRNPELCYITEGAFVPIVNDTINLVNNKDNVSCIMDGQVCDPQCVEIGCWGPGPTQCAKCKNAIIERTCIAECDEENGQYVRMEATDTEPTVCEYCDKECSAGCSGPGPENCDCVDGYDGSNCRRKCRNVQDGPYCRAECPEMKYANNQSNCTDCHSNCLDGCDGPENNVDDNGCWMCAQVMLDYRRNVIECMPASESCGSDYFYDRISLSQTSDPLAGSAICQQCDPQCIGCDGAGPQRCSQCRSFEENEECVECRLGTYPDKEHICQTCHPECRECYNGTEYDCYACESTTVWERNGTFFCASSCPPEYPYESYPYTCVAECPAMYFPNADFTCEQCHVECKDGCHNGSKEGCFSCKNVLWNSACYRECHVGYTNKNMTCIAVPLPPGQTPGQTADSPSKNGIQAGIPVGIAIGGTVLMILIIIAVVCYRKQPNNVNNLPSTEVIDMDGDN